MNPDIRNTLLLCGNAKIASKVLKISEAEAEALFAQLPDSDASGSPEEKRKRVEAETRAALYYQGCRLKGVVDSVLGWFYENEATERGQGVDMLASEQDKKGNRFFATKPVHDLVAAAEKAHGLMFQALGAKTSVEGIAPDDADQTDAVRGMHKQLAAITEALTATVPSRPAPARLVQEAAPIDVPVVPSAVRSLS